MTKYYEEVTNIPVIVFLLIIASASFYYQALVTEERFVPALNVISKKLRISDDVAGATLMAAGASSPELLAALVSVFITHSALGIGTVVGSEIFNQLVIGAASINASKNQRLVLDPVIVIRDVSFYALSLIVLFNALLDRRYIDEGGEEYLFISKFDAGLLLGCYVLYVIVCGNFDRILYLLHITPTKNREDDGYESFGENPIGGSSPLQKQISLSRVTSLPFVRSWGEKEHDEDSEIQKTPDRETSSAVVTELYIAESLSKDYRAPRTHEEHHKKPKKFIMDRLSPNLADVDGMNDIQRTGDGSISLYLWQRSMFYDKARIDMHAWQLKWFTFGECDISSISVRARKKHPVHDEHPIILPTCTSMVVDKSRRIIKISTTNRDYVFLAPSDEHLDAAIHGFERHLDVSLATEAMNEHSVCGEAHESLISYPRGMSKTELFLFCITFPLKALVHYTIPDVRTVSLLSPLAKASIATIVCILSLIVGSYAMVASLEKLGEILRIPSAIVGLTVSGAGTSLPILVSSQLAARLGLGNMAISNVFGSNTFNILVGLGLPWMMYTIIYDTEYHDLPVDGIDESMIVMAVALILFVLMVLHSGFVLLKWHALTFNILYVVFVLYSIGQCFV